MANIQLESETTTTAAKLPRLPRIEHPFAKQRGVDAAAATDSLRVRGLASRSNAARPSTGGALATAASTPNDRPATTTGLAELPSLHQKLPAVPEEEGVTAPQGAPIRAIGSRAFSRRIAVRPRTQGNQREQMTADDMIALLGEKFRTGCFYQINYAFKAFDATGKGNVSREALFRILTNLFPHLTNHTYQKLLERLGLNKRHAISFDDFYSHFHKKASIKWLDPVSRHGPRFMTAFQVHQQLRGKVRDRFSTMGELFPSGKTNGIVIKPEFRNLINRLNFPIEEEEFDKLWRRYDSEERGVIHVEKLMNKLGLSIKENAKGERILPRQSPPRKKRRNHDNDDDDDDDDDDGNVTRIEEMLREQFNKGFVRMRTAFRKVDARGTGKISREGFRLALSEFGIQLTAQECDLLLRRCGIAGRGQLGSVSLFSYNDFIRRFMDRREGSVASGILTDPNHEFNKRPGKVSAVTASGAESSLMKLFQGDFLSLLGTFQALDQAGTGLISKKEFRAILEAKLKKMITDRDFAELLRNVHLTSDGLVPYGEFLEKFDRGNTRQVFAANEKEDLDVEGEMEGRSVEEIEDHIRSILKPQYTDLRRVFEEIDESNLEHFNQTMLWEYFHRFQIDLTKSEMSRLWANFIKNANNTLDFHEFMRHFDFKIKSAGVTRRQRVNKKWTDDHCFQRSKTLHRSEDMVEHKLKAKLRIHFAAVRKRFAALDAGSTGLVDRSGFHEVVKNLVSDLTQSELDVMANRFDPFKDGRVSYVAFLEPFQPPDQTYRVGNDMSVLLSHKKRDVTEELQPVPAIPQNPTKGVPGLVINFRNQLLAQWKPLRRYFQKLDTSGKGLVRRDELRAVLKLCDVNVSDEDFEHVATEFQVSDGTISYREFLNALMDF